MRLSTDEKKLLAGYVHNIETNCKYIDFPIIGNERPYEKSRLVVFLEKSGHLKKVHEYFDNDKPKLPEAPDGVNGMKTYLDQRMRVETATHLLEKRGLVTIKKHETDSNVIFVALTIEGYTLGKRLQTFWGRLDVWYQDHKDGILGALFAILFGLLGGFLSHLLIGD